MQVWNLTNCKLRHNLAGHTGYINTVTVSPDGSLCASGGKVCTPLNPISSALADQYEAKCLALHTESLYSVTFLGATGVLLSVPHLSQECTPVQLAAAV